MKQGHSGVVTGISRHGDSYAEIEVTHGKRKPLTSAQKKQQAKYGDGAVSIYDSRPRSRLIVPASDASTYAMGQHVEVRCAPGKGSRKGGSHADAMDDYRDEVRKITRQKR